MQQRPQQTASDIGDAAAAPPLQAEVAACLPAFAVLRAQLGDSARQVEQAVVEVCQSFQGIVARARESVAQAERSLGSGDTSADKQRSHSQTLVAVARSMMERTEATTQACLQMVERMRQVEDEMSRITQSLNNVDDIAKAVRLLGFNATIEAARAGVHGMAFGVVAEETRELAGNAARINKSIQETVDQLRARVNVASQELRTMSTAFVSEFQASRAEVNEAVAAMAAAEEELRRSVERSAQVGKSLADDVSHAVMAMQFQDRTNQQIAHVVEALHGIEARLAGHARRGAAQPEVRRDSAEDLMRRYTMQSERDVHLAQVGAAAGDADAPDDNVELF